MPSRMRHGLLISLVAISLTIISSNTSYADTTNYVYDELNRLIRVEYADAKSGGSAKCGGSGVSP